MTDATSQTTFGRMFSYAMAASFIAAVIVGVGSAIGSAPAEKVGFDLTLQIDGKGVRAGGTTFVTDDAFSFTSSRLTFSGTIAADEVTIEGKVGADGPSAAQDFRTSGRRADGHLTAAVTAPDGRRLGSLRLEFLNP